jgi:signal transduction histidine kinase/ActR/RegA family two-component response regulator
MSKFEHVSGARRISLVRSEPCMADDERQRLRRLTQQTQRLLAETRTRQARFERLLDVAHDLACARTSEPAVLQRIAQRAEQLLGADSVAVLTPDGSTLMLRGGVGDAAALFGDAATEAVRSRLSQALIKGEPVALPEQPEARVGLAVPLRAVWQVIGVLAIARRDDRPFSSDDVLIATLFARHAAATLENAHLVAEIREADRRKDDFLARLAHELRNPLAPIVNAVHLLGRVPPHGARASKLRDIMTRQVAHLRALVDDLLDVSRIRAGKLAVDLRPIDLREIAQRSFEALQLSGTAKGHRVSMMLVKAPVMIQGDPARLQQVVSNLLTNAVKYTPRGGAIRLSVQRAGSSAVLTVRDEGIGLASESLPQIFKPFAQADRSLHRAQGGLGLGLALVQALVEQHGGEIVGESAGIGRGSVFTVRLPLTSAAEPVPSPDTVAPAVRPGRILIVEDNADAREALRAVLELEGHRVASAADCTTALDAARQFQPQIAVIDIGLPGVDGREIARRLRRQQHPREPYLVALTGYSQPEDRRRALEAGFDRYLVKPVLPAELFNVIATAQAAE